MTREEIREQAKEAFDAVHGRGLETLFEELWTNDREFRDALREASLRPGLGATAGVRNIARKHFESGDVQRRATATRALLEKKKSMRDQFVLSGGSEREFERQWPELRRELLRDEAKAAKQARDAATAQFYRARF